MLWAVKDSNSSGATASMGKGTAPETTTSIVESEFSIVCTVDLANTLAKTCRMAKPSCDDLFVLSAVRAMSVFAVDISTSIAASTRFAAPTSAQPSRICSAK